MRLALVALLFVGCAAPQVVTKPAPEVSPTFTVEQARAMAETCIEQAPPFEEECRCMARHFIGKPIRVERSELQEMIDRAFEECTTPAEGTVKL